MPRIPAITAKQLVRALKRAGFEEDRQKGSHLVPFHASTMRRVVVPMHSGRTIKKPLLETIIRKDMGMTFEEFRRLL